MKSRYNGRKTTNPMTDVMPFEQGYDYTGLIMFSMIMISGVGLLLAIIFRYSPIPPYKNMFGKVNPKKRTNL